jgi:hypothetical protein
LVARARTQAKVAAGIAADPGHGRSCVQPELRILLAEADRALARHQLLQADGREHSFIKGGRGGQIAHADRCVIDHASNILLGNRHLRDQVPAEAMPDVCVHQP